MSDVLVIGGTRFIGRHVVAELRDHDHAVTVFTRGNHPNPFADDPRVEHVTGDRRDDATVERVAETVDPDAVVDTIAFYPTDVETAVRVFDDVDAYVYVSSVAAYDPEHVLRTESRTPLVPCSPAEATDDSFETYGPRKAEADRIALAAPDEHGTPAMSVRPTMVYGPHNHLGFVRYWIDRVLDHDRVVVPGDGSYVCHRTYVADVASAVRTVLEHGEPGEAYNVADQRPVTMTQFLDRAADAADTAVEPVYASPRELAAADLDRAAFPLYMGTPFVMPTEKLAALGWASTPVDDAMAATVADHREHGLDYDDGPSRAAERRVLDAPDAH